MQEIVESNAPNWWNMCEARQRIYMSENPYAPEEWRKDALYFASDEFMKRVNINVTNPNMPLEPQLPYLALSYFVTNTIACCSFVEYWNIAVVREMIPTAAAIRDAYGQVFSCNALYGRLRSMVLGFEQHTAESDEEYDD
ncbi:MAG: hypothetical protein LBI30_00955 [Holosporales bacterium]|jgi:hypothetical protein|nr:hypothetical protein [Holosporales bacterium]